MSLDPCPQSLGSSCPTSASGTVLIVGALGRKGKKTIESPQYRDPRPSASLGMLSKFWEGLKYPEASGPLTQRAPAPSLMEKRKRLIPVHGTGHWRLQELY